MCCLAFYQLPDFGRWVSSLLIFLIDHKLICSEGQPECCVQICELSKAGSTYVFSGENVNKGLFTRNEKHTDPVALKF